jgi:hypothetical protein
MLNMRRRKFITPIHIAQMFWRMRLEAMGLVWGSDRIGFAAPAHGRSWHHADLESVLKLMLIVRGDARGA